MADVILTALFWLSFMLPGFVLARRLWPSALAGGVLPGIGVSALGSCVLLSPLSLLGYAFQLPLHVLSAGFALAVVTALHILGRTLRSASVRGVWRTELRAEPVLGWTVLLLILIAQARVGGRLDGDATYHAGRVRDLLEHGFNNADIYLTSFHFQHVYHTNLVHAVYATLAQLTQQSYLDTWFHTQPFAKLLAASGYCSLAYALVPDRRFAWLSALALSLASAGETYTLYPNNLAVHWLLPLGLATGVRALQGGAEHESALSQASLLAAISLVLGQVHSLYALYLGLLLGPFLLLAWGRKRARDARLALSLCALGLGAPFLLVSMYAHRPAETRAEVQEQLRSESSAEDSSENTTEDSAEPTTDARDDQPPPRAPATALASAPRKPARAPDVYVSGGGHLEKQLEQVGGGYALPTHQVGGTPFVLAGIAGLLLSCLLAPARQRRAFAWALSTALLLCAALFVPALCNMAVKLLQTQFAVARLGTLLVVLCGLGLLSLLFALGTRASAHSASRSWLLVVLSCLALGSSTQARGLSPRTFLEHVDDVMAPAATRHAQLSRLHEARALLTRVLPAQTLVMAQLRLGRRVVMLADLHVIAVDRGHTHVPSVPQRRADLRLLHARKTPWAVRQALLAHYGARYVVFPERSRQRYVWAEEHGRLLGTGGGLAVVELRRDELRRDELR